MGHDSDTDPETESWRDVRRRSKMLERESRRMRREERTGRTRPDHMHYDSACGRPIYRSRNGMIFGVCRGVAEYLGFSVKAFRIIAVVATVVFGFWPLIIGYIIVALVMKPEPVVPFEEDSEQEFYDSYVSSRSMALSRLKRTFDNLERRIRRMENLVTAHEYDWERRLNER
ncbi:MAG: envelope stress response membrane protein PspC [Candidatus Hydrogenedentes bacterium]|nr:envelope stress response membrane protein PspC [Candidatus Hydrogenedentota bacterium]